MKPKIILITGVSRGLGSCFARAFAEKGDIVLGLYRESFDFAKRLSDEIIQNNGNCKFYKADIKKYQDVKKVIEDIKSQYQTIDVLINNAAIIRDAVMIKIKDVDWDEVLDTNLKGAFLMIRECIPLMNKKNELRKHIVNVASISARTGAYGQANYAASKAGLIALTKVAAMELAEFKISVNAFIPGLLKTDMTEKLNLPETRYGRSIESIAEGIYYFTNNTSITGQILSLEDRITKDDTL